MSAQYFTENGKTYIKQSTGRVKKLSAGQARAVAKRGKTVLNAAQLGGASGVGFESPEDQAVISSAIQADGGSSAGARDRSYSSGGASSVPAPVVSSANRGAPTVGGQTANSSGSFFGKAGVNNLGTKVGDTQGTGIDRTAGIAGGAFSEYMNFLSPSSVIDRQQAIRDEMTDSRQGQLDAIRDKYKARVADEQAVGQEDLARQRSMNLRAGLGGSDFGAANKIEVRDRTRSNVNTIEANEEIEVGNLMTTIDQLAEQRIASEENALQQGLTNSFAFQELQDQQRTQAIESIGNLGKAGFGLEDIKQRDPDTYASLQASTGMSDVELEAILNNNKPVEERIDYTHKIVGGKLISFGVDPKTGKQVMLEQDVDIPDGYKVTTMPDGTVLAIPEKLTLDNMSDIITVGNYAKPVAAKSSGLTPYQQFSATQSISKDTQARTATAREMTRQAGLIANSFKNIQEGGDQSLNTQAIIVSFNKILDPTSVVRESEYDRTAQGQSLLNQLEGKVQNITTGGAGVTTATLEEAKNIATQYLDGAKTSINEQNKRATDMATSFGLNPDFVTSVSPQEVAQSVSSQVDSAGYDYQAMVADGLSDDQILQAISGQ